jgi:predicted small secreted protein
MVKRMKRLRLYCLLVVLAALSGCGMTLPGAPSDLTTGIVVYEHANYLGQSAHITKDIR